MANIPTFNQLANYRYNGFNNQITPRLIGYGAIPPEERTVPSSAPYIILLHESPQFNVPSTTRIWDDTDSVSLTEVSKTTTPANRQFRVNYDERGNGQVEFNGNQKSHALEISYYGEGSLAKIETLQSTQQAITNVQITTIDTDTILSDDQGGTGTLQLEFDCRTGDKTVTLPDAALNEGLRIGWKVLYWGGRAILDGKGADTIDGYSEIYGDDKNNSGEIYSNGTEWKIRYIKHTIKFFDDSRFNSDWTNRQLGSTRIQYDNKVGNFIPGEILVESVSGVEFIFMIDDGTYLYVKNAEFYATNNRTLTGQTSGATCDVDEATGSTTNRDSYIALNLLVDRKNIDIRFYVTTNGDFDNEVFLVQDAWVAGADFRAWNYQQVSAGNFELATGNSGIGLLMPGGSLGAIAGESYYYHLYVMIYYNF